MKNMKINEQGIFNRFHTYTSMDVRDVLDDLCRLIYDRAQFAEGDSIEDKLLDVIEYCTYNKGEISYKHKLGLLLFAGCVDDEDSCVIDLVFAKSERGKEIWKYSVRLTWIDDKVKVEGYDLQLTVDGKNVELAR
jgi:hypothetical protein